MFGRVLADARLCVCVFSSLAFRLMQARDCVIVCLLFSNIMFISSRDSLCNYLFDSVGS